MRHTLLSLLLLGSALLIMASCRKAKNESPEGDAAADIWKMGGIREWTSVSTGVVTDIDSNEVRYIAKTYSDTSKVYFAIQVLDDSDIMLRGYHLKLFSVDEINRILLFKSDKRHNPQAYYDLAISLYYFARQDSIYIKQDSTFNYDPNTLNICSNAGPQKHL